LFLFLLFTSAAASVWQRTAVRIVLFRNKGNKGNNGKMKAGLVQGFPTFFLPCTPSAFRQMSMYPYSISTDKDVPPSEF